MAVRTRRGHELHRLRHRVPLGLGEPSGRVRGHGRRGGAPDPLVVHRRGGRGDGCADSVRGQAGGASPTARGQLQPEEGGREATGRGGGRVARATRARDEGADRVGNSAGPLRVDDPILVSRLAVRGREPAIWAAGCGPGPARDRRVPPAADRSQVSGLLAARHLRARGREASGGLDVAHTGVTGHAGDRGRRSVGWASPV